MKDGVLNIDIDKEIYARLLEFCHEYETSFNKVVELALDSFLGMEEFVPIDELLNRTDEVKW